MLLVSHEKTFIYLKCGKTASTSTEAFFQSFCGDTKCRHNVTQVSAKGIVSHPFHPLPGTVFRAHMAACELKPLLGDDKWETYYKFANVRNPFDAMVSAYFDQKPYYPEEISFEAWWAERRNRGDSMWGVIAIDDRIAVDHVIRYESLLENLAQVCQRLEVDFDRAVFPKLRTEERPTRDGRKIAYEEIITSQSVKDDIEFVFEKTFQAFGYRY